jgi:hypothetical protein
LQKIRLAAAALLLGGLFAPALTPPALGQTCACPGAGIRADAAPPPLPDYDQPPIPSPGYLWTPGYWAWNNYEYYWVPGTWVEPPRPGLLWTPGYWALVDGVYAFNAGYWAPHVGFYGGVSYGFGYGGAGYEGGYWRDGAFYYNRSVNNVGGARIVNVYEKTVVIDKNASRASFNGPGGSAARPSPEEQAAAAEPHVERTPAQVAHAREASMKGDLFVSANHGKPAIAATATAAAFTGPGVIRAKAAGATKVQYPGGEPPPAAAPGEERKRQEKNDLRPGVEPGAGPSRETATPEKGGNAAPGKERTGAEPNAEKKGESGRSGAEAEKAKAVTPAGEERKTPSAEPEKRLAPAAERKPDAEAHRPAAAVERRPPPEAAKHAPEARQDQHPPAHPREEECGKPGKPKCP